MRTAVLPAVVLAAALAAGPASAQTTYTWKTTTGTWNTTTANWTTTVSNSIAWSNGTGQNVAVFSSTITTPSTVTVAAAITANRIEFSTGNARLVAGTYNFGFSTGAITLGGTTPAVLVTAGNAAEINIELKGTGGLTKLGDGTLFLSKADTYTGGTTISAGTLKVGVRGAMGGYANNLTIASGATLDLNGVGGGSSNTSGVLVGTLSGAGTVTNTSASATSLEVDTNGGTSTFAGTITQATGAGAVSLVKTWGGSLTLTGANTYTGGTVAGGGTLYLGAGGSILGNVAITDGVDGSTGANAHAAFGFNRSDAFTFAGKITGAGTGGVVVDGGGTVTLTGTNTYTGGTTVTNGTLIAGSGSAFGAAGGKLAVDGVVDLNGYDRTVGALSGAGTVTNTAAGPVMLSAGIASGFSTFAGTITQAPGAGAVALTKTGSGTLTLTGANTYAGGTTASAGTLYLGTGGSILGDVTTTAAFGFNRTDTFTFGGKITGSGTVVQGGAGAVTLAGDNNYTGGTVTLAGTLKIDSATAFGTGGLTANGGTFDLNGYSPSVPSLNGSGTGVVTNSAAGTTATLTVNQSYSTFAGSIRDGAGRVALVKDGGYTTNELVLTGTNTYTGGTTVTTGYLILGNGGTTGSIAGDVVTNTAASFTFNRSDAFAFAGNISGSGNVSQSGSGVVTLSGTNTYRGYTLVQNGGTVKVGSASPFGSSTVLIDAASTLDLNGYTVFPKDVQPRSGGTGTVTNTAATAATIIFSENTAAFAGTITQKAGAGATGVYKYGSKDLTLTGANSYAGGTTVYGGRVVVGSAAALGTGDLTVLTGAGVELNGYNVTVGRLAGVGTVTNSVAGGGTLTVGGGNASSTFTGTLKNGTAGVLSLAKTGTGTFTLAGAETYTGGTTLAGGTFQLGAANVLPDAGPVTFAGGTLRTGSAAGFSDAVGPLALAGGGTIALGTGGHALTFDGIAANPTGTLAIAGWTGLPNGGHLYFRLPNEASAAQADTDYAGFLGHVQFAGFALGAAELLAAGSGTYELVPVPVPEPAAVLGAAAAGLGLARRARRWATRAAA